jgi:hypothetical protein
VDVDQRASNLNAQASFQNSAASIPPPSGRSVDATPHHQTVWLASIAHEGDSYLELEDDEALSLETAVPDLRLSRRELLH